jgi:hypothetical protein
MRGWETRCECYRVLEIVSEGDDGDDRWGFQRVWGGDNLPESPRCRHNVLRMGREHTRQVLESQSGGRGRVSCWHLVPLRPPSGWSPQSVCMAHLIQLTAHHHYHNSRPEKPKSGHTKHTTILPPNPRPPHHSLLASPSSFSPSNSRSHSLKPRAKGVCFQIYS